MKIKVVLSVFAIIIGMYFVVGVLFAVLIAYNIQRISSGRVPVLCDGGGTVLDGGTLTWFGSGYQIVQWHQLQVDKERKGDRGSFYKVGYTLTLGWTTIFIIPNLLINENTKIIYEKW